MSVLGPVLGPHLRPISLSLTRAGVALGPSLESYGPSDPLYIAHRGGSLMYPEETIEGYAASYAAGNRVLEMDVQALSDGTLCLMHDSTVDRTTTGTGNVSSFDTAGWRALQIDAGSWFGGGWGNDLSAPLFADILGLYANNRTILVPEAKASGVGAPMVAAMQAAGVSIKRGLFQSTLLAELSDAVAAGYPAMYLAGTDTTSISAAQAAGVTWVGLDIAAADSVFTAWKDAGFKVGAYTIRRRDQRDRVLALGVSALFVDDPKYASVTAPLATTDNFASQAWQPGMVGKSSSTAVTDRGKFTSPDLWELPVDGSNFTSCLQGWACPIKGDPDATSFTIDFKVTFRTPNAGDQTRWAAVFLGKNDKAFNNGVAPTADQQGFTFLTLKEGHIQIYQRSTSATTQVASKGTLAIADDEEVAYRIVMTPTDVSIHRLDGSGAIAYTATFASSDTAYRGSYLHLCRSGLGAAFRDIAILP